MGLPARPAGSFGEVVEDPGNREHGEKCNEGPIRAGHGGLSVRGASAGAASPGDLVGVRLLGVAGHRGPVSFTLVRPGIAAASGAGVSPGAGDCGGCGRLRPRRYLARSVRVLRCLGLAELVSGETRGRGRVVLARITEAGRKAAASFNREGSAAAEAGKGMGWIIEYQTLARPGRAKSGRSENQGDWRPCHGNGGQRFRPWGGPRCGKESDSMTSERVR